MKSAPVWAEVVALAIGVPLAGLAVSPEDPFFLRAEFPWPVAGPLLVGLRYGSLRGLAACGISLLTLALAHRAGLIALTAVPGRFAVAMVFCALAAGEFRDGWERRLRAAEQLADSRKLRLDAFARVYHLLRASHDRLEERLAASAPSLRTLLTELRRRPIPPGRAALETLGDGFLACLGAQCGLLAGSVLSVAAGGGRPGAQVACLGTMPDAATADPLVYAAISERKLVVARPDAGSTLFAAVPLVDAGGQLHGVVAIRELFFPHRHENALKLIALAAGHFADLLVHRSAETQAGSVVFLDDLRRAVSDLRDHGTPSGLLLITGPRLSTLQGLLAQRRTVDPALLFHDAGALAILAPFTDAADLERFAARLHRGTGGEVTVTARPITAADTVDSVLRFIHPNLRELHAHQAPDIVRALPRALELGGGAGR